jgi:hypothetical protein
MRRRRRSRVKIFAVSNIDMTKDGETWDFPFNGI